MINFGENREKWEIDAMRGLIMALQEGTLHLDLHTHLHHKDVRKYVEIICTNYGMARREVRLLSIAAELHDLGKIGVLDLLTRYRDERLEVDSPVMVAIRRHCEIGVKMVSSFLFALGADTTIRQVMETAVLSHHERWDGKGYPHGLKAFAIPLVARIVCVGDCISGMAMAERPWKVPLPLEKVVQELRDCAGSHFDPEVATLTASMLESGRLSLDHFV